MTTPEAIEAAMTAADALGRDDASSWSDAHIMRAALTAAAPHIAAQALREAVDEIESRPDMKMNTTYAAITQESVNYLRARAAELEGKN